MSGVIYPCDDGCQCGQEPCRSNNPAYYTSRFLRDGLAIIVLYVLPMALVGWVLSYAVEVLERQ